MHCILCNLHNMQFTQTSNVLTNFCRCLIEWEVSVNIMRRVYTYLQTSQKQVNQPTNKGWNLYSWLNSRKHINWMFSQSQTFTFYQSLFEMLPNPLKSYISPVSPGAWWNQGWKWTLSGSELCRRLLQSTNRVKAPGGGGAPFCTPLEATNTEI